MAVIDDKINEKMRMPFFVNTLNIILFCVCCLLFGLLYVVFQWLRLGRVDDSLFVGMLTGATFLLCVGLRSILFQLIRESRKFNREDLSLENTEQLLFIQQKLTKSFSNNSRFIASGLVYALAVGISPILLGIWETDILLGFSMLLFLFLVNFATGIAFLTLFEFFRYVIFIGPRIKINLWKKTSPISKILFEVIRKIVLLSSIYIGICISSISFSKFPIGGLIVGYSSFSAIILLSTLIIPVFPIMQKKANAKYEALLEIDHKLDHLFANAMEKMRNDQVLKNEKFDELLELRHIVQSVDVMPLNIKWASTGAGVLFFTFAPVFLDFILANF